MTLRRRVFIPVRGQRAFRLAVLAAAAYCDGLSIAFE